MKSLVFLLLIFHNFIYGQEIYHGVYIIPQSQGDVKFQIPDAANKEMVDKGLRNQKKIQIDVYYKNDTLIIYPGHFSNSSLSLKYPEGKITLMDFLYGTAIECDLEKDIGTVFKINEAKVKYSLDSTDIVYKEQKVSTAISNLTPTKIWFKKADIYIYPHFCNGIQGIILKSENLEGTSANFELVKLEKIDSFELPDFSKLNILSLDEYYKKTNIRRAK